MSTTPLRREIDGTLYELELWDTDTALGWQQQLMQLGLEPVGQLLSDAPPDCPIDEAPYAVLARTLAKKLEDRPVPQLLKSLLCSVSIVVDVQGKEAKQRLTDKGTWEKHFRGRLMTAHKLAWWVLEENLADFIVAARSFVEVLRSLWQNVSKLMPGVASSESEAAVPASEQEPDLSSAS